MKFSRQLVFACNSLAVLALTACSESAVERHQAEDDFTYLNTKAFQQWQLPEGAVPQFTNDYVLPKGHYAGHLGKRVDIRAPEEVLALFPGLITSQNHGTVYLTFARPALADEVWQQLTLFLRQNHVAFQQTGPSMLKTEHVLWTPKDEDMPLSGQYQFERIAKDGRVEIVISLQNLTQSGESQMHNMSLVERYTAVMANTITRRVEHRLQQAAEQKARENRRHIAFQMGSDRSGFPVVIARAEYAVIWERLPVALRKIGFKIDDQSRSDGSIKVKYVKPDDDVWQTLGVKPLTIDSGTYTLMLGDLENRTSINVTNEKGKPISETDLDGFEPVLSALLSR